MNPREAKKFQRGEKARAVKQRQNDCCRFCGVPSGIEAWRHEGMWSPDGFRWFTASIKGAVPAQDPPKVRGVPAMEKLPRKRVNEVQKYRRAMKPHRDDTINFKLVRIHLTVVGSEPGVIVHEDAPITSLVALCFHCKRDHLDGKGPAAGLAMQDPATMAAGDKVSKGGIILP